MASSLLSRYMDPGRSRLVVPGSQPHSCVGNGHESMSGVMLVYPDGFF